MASVTKSRSLIVARLGLLGAAIVLPLSAPQAAAPSAAAKAAWRAAIAATPRPSTGCFTAAFPGRTWVRTACTAAPNRPFLPRSGGNNGFTVGDGHDYAASVSTLIASTTGTFPTIKGLVSETGNGGANDYSLQLNSQFFASPACSGASDPAGCVGWQQFIYSSDYTAAFMQYWLIDYNATCPAGWATASSDCYTNSAAVGVPLQVITQLGNLKLEAMAGASTDTLTMTTDTDAYSTSGPDSMVGLAGYWKQSEFNVFGDGGGNTARFNAGTKLTVNIEVTTSPSVVPRCQANSGTTAETNNLTLRKCSVKRGVAPSVQFLESN